MPELAKDTVALLSFLLPGFIVAWVLYALTSHPKPSQAERVIQALVFTLFVKVLVVGEQAALEFVGRWFSLRAWDQGAELLASLTTGLGLGLVAAWVVNRDQLHQRLRKLGISSRSSHPSEWCDVFTRYPLFVVLHYKDDRRLLGWPEIWPSDPERGHFFVVLPQWVHGPEPMKLEGTEGVLVDVRDIKHVEFVKRKEKGNGN